MPDIVLYNNADGTYEVNTITKAHVVKQKRTIKIERIISIRMYLVLEWNNQMESTRHL